MAASDSLHDVHHDHEHHHHHAPPVQAWLKTALLIGLGLYFAYIILSGNLTNYINVRFAWLSYIAAGLFLLLGGASVYRLLHENAHEHHHDHDHAHDHSTISWRALAVVAVPLVLGTLIPSQPLGAAAVDGEFNTIGGDTATAFDIAPLDRNILDWVRLFNPTDDMSVFNGQEIDVTGFVFRSEAYPDDLFMVSRFTISCCVADSLAIGVPVIWDQDIPPDTWVQVRGRLQAGDFQGSEQAIIRPERVDIVQRPEHPYLYP